MHCIIIDDEPQARKLLTTYLTNLGNCTIVNSCSNAIQAYEILHTNKIDLMFLDIKMPVISGLDFLKSLKNPPMVIITTAYNKYAMDGYELNVVDYLMKPISYTRLIQALDKAKTMMSRLTQPLLDQHKDYLFVKVNTKYVKISYNDILYIEGMQNYVKIHVLDQVLIASYTMKWFERFLPANKFIRVHRSFIVPVSLINAINGNKIETNYREIPIGISYKEGLLKTFIPK